MDYIFIVCASILTAKGSKSQNKKQENNNKKKLQANTLDEHQGSKCKILKKYKQTEFNSTLKGVMP